MRGPTSRSRLPMECSRWMTLLHVKSLGGDRALGPWQQWPFWKRRSAVGNGNAPVEVTYQAHAGEGSGSLRASEVQASRRKLSGMEGLRYILTITGDIFVCHPVLAETEGMPTGLIPSMAEVNNHYMVDGQEVEKSKRIEREVDECKVDGEYKTSQPHLTSPSSPSTVSTSTFNFPFSTCLPSPAPSRLRSSRFFPPRPSPPKSRPTVCTLPLPLVSCGPNHL